MLGFVGPFYGMDRQGRELVVCGMARHGVVMETLFDKPVRFFGETYSPELDRERLTGQLGRVYTAMSPGAWMTLAEIRTITLDPEASISARIRQLRDLKMTVDRRRRGEPKAGLWEYRLVLSRGENPIGVPDCVGEKSGVHRAMSRAEKVTQ